MKKTVNFLFLSLLSMVGLVLLSSELNFKKNTIPKEETEEVWVGNQLKKMSLEEQIAQFFMIAAYSNDSESELLKVEHQVKANKIGGIIFFQGERDNLNQCVKRFQTVSKTPLFIGMDAEWGVKMRLFGEERLPYAYTIGAANNVELSKDMGAILAQECQELGIHMAFAPVADVNSNPKNPVIGFRSFGQSPENVAKMVEAFVKGMEDNGVMSCIKHFPGHGNTDKDSHYELPNVSSSLDYLHKNDLIPFERGIQGGSSSVMVGHLSVPALDASNTPASLSKAIISDLLIKKMRFNGLVISDALNMKAVADKYGKTEVVVKAFEAGCDILLYPESVDEAIKAIANKVRKGEIKEETIHTRCKKILKAKYKFIIAKRKASSHTLLQREAKMRLLYEKSITVLKNEAQALPLKTLTNQLAIFAIGENKAAFRDACLNFRDFDYYHFNSVEEAIERIPFIDKEYDEILFNLHSNTVRTKNNFGFGFNLNTLMNKLPKAKEMHLFVFGNPLVLSTFSTNSFASVSVAFENHPFAQIAMAQMIFGAESANAKLPFSINEQWSIGYGLEVQKSGRLKQAIPEMYGISSASFKEIDEIVQNGIEKGAFPGCQIAINYKGALIYQKSFGKQTYEGNQKVNNDDLYDIASVSKIASSTMALLLLNENGKIELDKTLGFYIPELVGNTEFSNIKIREMMAHQAGLTAWIPFYKKTLISNEWNPKIFSSKKKQGFDKQVAENMWINNNYEDSIYKQILKSGLGDKKYLYSDLGYYFLKKIIEKQTNQSIDQFVSNEIYKPLGLRNIGYQPLKRFSKNKICPTEDDQVFRKQLIQGYVHDPGAAMLGGIAGHAGVFSNAGDLAILFQSVLNKGKYGKQLFSRSVIEEFTKAQFPGNRRGVGFDRPNLSGGGTCHELASQESFGHSGFTGTLVWADFKYDLNYVFLSNRVYRNADNWKLRDMNIRTEIQRVIYQAIQGK